MPLHLVGNVVRDPLVGHRGEGSEERDFPAATIDAIADELDPRAKSSPKVKALLRLLIKSISING